MVTAAVSSFVCTTVLTVWMWWKSFLGKVITVFN